MATLVLSAAGNLLLPGAGQIIGAVLGSMVDNIILGPDQRGPRLDDLQLQSASEGSPIYYVLGQENRTPATIIWVSRPKSRKSGGGKGGGAPARIKHSVDIAVEFCEGEITKVDKIWANGSVIYDETPDLAITSNQISVIRTLFEDWFTPALPVQAVFGDLTSPNGGPDLSQFRSGKNITVSGFTGGGTVNNGTFKVVSATMDPATGISTCRVENQNAANASAGPTVTLSQTLPKFSPNIASAFEFYLGTATQNPDPTMEGYLGAGNVSAYRHKAYVVIRNFQLQDFGNALPQFQAMPQKTFGAQTLASGVSELLIRGGRLAEEFDVTALAGQTLKGYAIRGPMSVARQLEALILAFDILTQEDNGVLRFFLRTAPQEIAISEDFFGAHEPGEEVPQKIEFLDPSNVRLPNEVNVNYIDPELDYQVGSQRERRADVSPIADSIVRLSVPVTMSAVDGRKLCKRAIWTAHANRHGARFNLPPSKLEVLEHDLVSTTNKGIPHKFLTQKIDFGANGLLQCEAVREQTQTLTQTAVAEPGGAPGSSSVFFPPSTYLYIVSSAGPFRDEEAELPGFYWAGMYADPKEPFFGATLYMSTDGGANYEAVQEMDAEAVMGRATTALADAPNCAHFDYDSTITIKLFDPDDELVSVTEEQCLRGANRAMLGGECIGFVTATLTATGTYVLSGLLRGLRNTEDFATTHLIGDPFVLLEDTTLNFLQLPLSSFHTTCLFKLVAQGGVVGDYAPATHTVVHPCLRHFTPAGANGQRNNVNGDILVTWTRRSRSMARLFGGMIPPLLDEIERYRLEIYNPVNTFRSAHIIEDATEFLATEAIQTAAFMSPGEPMFIRLVQISSLVGDSYVLRATV